MPCCPGSQNYEMEMTFLNFTPHTITLNDGTAYESVGVARVANTFSDFDECGVCSVEFGDIQGLPEPQEGTLLIVTELPFKEGEQKEFINFFDTFGGKAATLAKKALKMRIDHCLLSLSEHIGKATRVNSGVVEWKNGAFSVGAYNAMEDALDALESSSLDISRYGAIQGIKAVIALSKRCSDERREAYEEIKVSDYGAFDEIVEYVFNVFCEIALTADK